MYQPGHLLHIEYVATVGKEQNIIGISTSFAPATAPSKLSLGASSRGKSGRRPLSSTINYVLLSIM